MVVNSSWKTYGKRDIYHFLQKSRRNERLLVVTEGRVGMRFCLRYNYLSFYFSYIEKSKNNKRGKYLRELFPWKEGIDAGYTSWSAHPAHTKLAVALDTSVAGEDFICLKKDFKSSLD